MDGNTNLYVVIQYSKFGAYKYAWNYKPWRWYSVFEILVYKHGWEDEPWCDNQSIRNLGYRNMKGNMNLAIVD